MKQYKDNNEAAKYYADLLYGEQNYNQQKLQHEAVRLDFAAGANWKEEQLRLSAVVQRSELLFAFIVEVKKEFPDQNWDYLDIIAERVLNKIKKQ